MLYFDAALVNLVERGCRHFQRLTGRTNVWLAVQLTNLSIIVYFVWAGAYFWSAGAKLRLFVAVFCAGVLFVLTNTLFKEPIESYESNAFRRVAKGLVNPRRVRDVLLRLSFVMLSVALPYPVIFVYVNLHTQPLLLTYSLIVLTTAVLYLLACDPLPPAAVKAAARAPGRAAARVPATESRISGEAFAKAPAGRRMRWTPTRQKATTKTGRTTDWHSSIYLRKRTPTCVPEVFSDCQLPRFLLSPVRVCCRRSGQQRAARRCRASVRRRAPRR
jgi:hypothetical protein